MIPLLLALSASAQTLDYAFATTPAHLTHWYPTAYFDHGGSDWNCGNTTYSGHRGNDFGAGSFTGMDAGRDITATAPGIVTHTHDGEFDRCTTADCAGGGGFGNHVRITHTDGKETVYAHLKKFSLTVAPGDFVDCGEVVGEMGSSGYSTGPHLHLGVYTTASTWADPFDGPCSFPPSWWVSQGAHGALPALTCGTYPTCSQVQTLTCGDVVTAASDGPGSTNTHRVHGCTQFVYSGPEMAYGIHTPLNEPVTLRLTGLTADLDLYVSDTDACDGRGCLAASHAPNTSDEEAVFDAVAGQVYTAIIDGWGGAVSGYTLSVDCHGLPPDPDPDTDVPDTGTPAVDPDPVDTGGPPDPDGGPSSDPRVEPGGRESGCACATTRGPAGPWLALLLPMLLRRRR